MPIDTMLASVAFALLVLGMSGGPMLVVDWSRNRRQQEIARQIALTDAIDGRVGAIVAPVVRKPLFRPWEIRMAVPISHSATVARILSVVDEVFWDVETPGSHHYRIFLSTRRDQLREAAADRTRGSATRWAGEPIGAV